jgi:hypothetical protein
VRATWRVLAGRRDLRLVLSAGIISMTGDWILTIGLALTLAGLITLFQRSSEDAYRGRVFGAVSALEGVTVLAGTLGSGYLSRLAGIIPVLAVQGAGYVVAGLAMLVWLKEEPGEPASASVQRRGEPALVTAEG